MAQVALPHMPRHVVQRGRNRQMVFAGDEDYERYLDDLRELGSALEYPGVCILPDDQPCASVAGAGEVAAMGRLMKALTARATRYRNRFEGRRHIVGWALQIEPGAEGGLSAGGPPLASWHQIQDPEAMKQDIQQVVARIPEDQMRIVLQGDGAALIWNTVEPCFAEGRPVLDHYHCAEHVHKLADARYGHCARAIEWVEATLARLAAHQVDGVIWGMQRLRADALARAEIDKLITSLQNHRQRIDYDACKAEGLPIGSGGIESANKFISHARLKRSGAWWVVANGNGMLRLRCALYNGTFDRVFEKYRSEKIRILGTKA